MPFQKPTGLADGLGPESALGCRNNPSPLRPADPSRPNALGSPCHTLRRGLGGHKGYSVRVKGQLCQRMSEELHDRLVIT